MSIANRMLQVMVALSLAFLMGLPGAWGQHQKEQVIGTWKLISLEYHRSDGEVFFPMGPDAVGWITYTADGRMAVQIMKPDRLRFGSNSIENAAVLPRQGENALMNVRVWHKDIELIKKERSTTIAM